MFTEIIFNVYNNTILVSYFCKCFSYVNDCFVNDTLHVIVSEPHIDQFAVNFPYNVYTNVSVVRHAISHFRLLFCVFSMR